MLKKKISLALILLLSTFTLYAQSLSYSGFVNAGAMFGSNNTKLHAQTIHGVKMDTWFAGAGVAIDDYFMQSFPLFIDIRKHILKKTNTPFVYADGGVNLVRKDEALNTAARIEYDPGFFYEGGAGYAIALNTRLNLNFSAGYSFKGYTEETFSKAYIPTGTSLKEEWVNDRSDIFKLKRFGLKVGLQF